MHHNVSPASPAASGRTRPGSAQHHHVPATDVGESIGPEARDEVRGRRCVRATARRAAGAHRARTSPSPRQGAARTPRASDGQRTLTMRFQNGSGSRGSNSTRLSPRSRTSARRDRVRRSSRAARAAAWSHRRCGTSGSPLNDSRHPHGDPAGETVLVAARVSTARGAKRTMSNAQIEPEVHRDQSQPRRRPHRDRRTRPRRLLEQLGHPRHPRPQGPASQAPAASAAGSPAAGGACATSAEGAGTRPRS